MQAQKRGKYTVKTFYPELYTWSPVPADYKNQLPLNITKDYCNAVAGSQGEDWISTYCYNQSIQYNTIYRFAYVECNYVQ